MTTAFLLLAALAHDFWIEPTTFAPQPGQIVGLRLRVGQDLLGDPVPRDPSLVDRFVAGGQPVAGRDGADPAGYFRFDSPGLTVVGYQSRPSRVELPPDKFAAYLKEEGLAPRKAGPEIFSRCAKSLVGGSGADRALGFTLELIAEANPIATRDLPVRLLYQGRPLSGALVVAFNRRNPSAKQSARSDAQGRVRIQIAHPGLWLVKAVHMVAAPVGVNADWSSYWASLTFETK